MIITSTLNKQLFISANKDQNVSGVQSDFYEYWNKNCDLHMIQPRYNGRYMCVTKVCMVNYLQQPCIINHRHLSKLLVQIWFRGWSPIKVLKTDKIICAVSFFPHKAPSYLCQGCTWIVTTTFTHPHAHYVIHVYFPHT